MYYIQFFSLLTKAKKGKYMFVQINVGICNKIFKFDDVQILDWEDFKPLLQVDTIHAPNHFL